MVLKHRYILFALMTGLLLWACGAGNSGEKKTAEAEKPDGLFLYTKKCAACHGPDGDKGVSGAKNLKETTFSDAEKKQIILQGKGSMPAFKISLSSEEADAIVEYIRSFQP